MKTYSIINSKRKQINKKFKNETEARHYVINHLDLSEEWSIFFIKGDKMKLTNKQIIAYLIDCLGYDELAIDEIKDNYRGCLSDCLSKQEKEDCLNYNL